MRPLLNPALRALWRDETSVQLGVDSEHALVLRGLEGPTSELIARLDGTSTLEELMFAAPAIGLTGQTVSDLVAEMERRGVIVDAALPAELGALPEVERLRLEPDVAAWSTGDGVPRKRGLLAARRRAMVVVQGAGRLGAALTGLLAAAAVGRLLVADEYDVRPSDLSPGGHRPAGIGAGRAASAAGSAVDVARSARVAAARVPPRAGAGERRPDLVVLAPDGPAPASGRCGQLLADDVPHLLATTYERVATVGPLVIPGRTPCATCLELHRVDRDPAWPTVSAQLSGPGTPMTGVRATPACDVVLATFAATLAATAVLAYLDEPDRPHELAGALVQVRPPNLRPRRRSWSMHPACGCGWQAAFAGDHKPQARPSTSAAPCTSRIRRMGDGSVQTTDRSPPTAASQSVVRRPSHAPHQPPASAPSGRIP